MELLIEQSIFSILYRDKNKNEIRHVGTGVVVCKKGIFITAGHTFRQKGDFELEDFRACFIVMVIYILHRLKKYVGTQ